MQYKVKCLCYPEDQSTWEPEENILDKCLFEKFEHGLRRDRQKNLVYSMFESQFIICFSLCNVVSAWPSNLNQQINCIFLPHDKPDRS